MTFAAHADRPLVYIAGPYQFPDPVENTRAAIIVADELQSEGAITAYVPHMNLLWNLVIVHPPAFWYDYDLAILARCDALLRIPGKSVGADDEIDFAKKNDIPVFFDADELLMWVNNE